MQVRDRRSYDWLIYADRRFVKVGRIEILIYLYSPKIFIIFLLDKRRKVSYNIIGKNKLKKKRGIVDS